MLLLLVLCTIGVCFYAGFVTSRALYRKQKLGWKLTCQKCWHRWRIKNTGGFEQCPECGSLPIKGSYTK